MNKQKIVSAVDHTLLGQTATWSDIKAICDDGIAFGVASVCIPASFISRAKSHVGDKLKLCTVIGFPNGYSTTATKVFETQDAIKNGADEIDMVANIGYIKDGMFVEQEKEIRDIKEACGKKVLKVIIETCLLTEEEKIEMCHVVTRSGADFIKTSTGFSTNGATPEDIKLFAQHVGPDVQIKAAGGISSMEDGELFLSLGATRLGTSRIVKIIKNEDTSGY